MDGAGHTGPMRQCRTYICTVSTRVGPKGPSNARTEEVVMVPQVGNNVMFQPAVGGPYTLIAHVSRTICLVYQANISARARDFIEVGARRGLWASRGKPQTF